MVDVAVSAQLQSPLLRNLGNIPTDSTNFTYHVEHNAPPFSFTKTTLTPYATASGWDTTYQFRLPGLGSPARIYAKLRFKIHPTDRTHITPVLAMYHLIEEVTLRSHNTVIATLYGDQIMIKHAYFNTPEAAVSKMSGTINLPIDARNMVDLGNVFADVTTGVNWRHLDASTWSTSSNNYRWVTLWLELPFSFTDNPSMYLDTRFVEQLDVDVKLVSEKKDNPLFQAAANLEIDFGGPAVGYAREHNNIFKNNGNATNSDNWLASFAAVGSDGIIDAATGNPAVQPIDANSDSTIITSLTANCRSRHLRTAPVMVGACDGKDKDAGESYYFPATGRHVNVNDSAHTDAYSSGRTMPGGESVTSDMGLLVSNSMQHVRIGPCDYDSTSYTVGHQGDADGVLSTGLSTEQSAAAINIFYAAYPWLNPSNQATANGGCDWMMRHTRNDTTAEAYPYTAGGDTGSIPSTILIEGGKSNTSSSFSAVPTASDTQLRLVVVFINYHDRIREAISVENFEESKPTSILIDDVYREKFMEKYGQSGAEITSAMTDWTFTIRPKFCTNSIILLAYKDDTDAELVGGDIYDAGKFFGTIGNQAADKHFTVPFESDSYQYLNLSQQVMSEIGRYPNAGNSSSATNSATGDIGTYSDVCKAHEVGCIASRSDYEWPMYKVIRKTETIRPVYAKLEVAGRTLWESAPNTDVTTDIGYYDNHQNLIAGTGNPTFELDCQNLSMNYNRSLARGEMGIGPMRLPNLLEGSIAGGLAKYCNATVISFALNKTDLLSNNGALALVGTTNPQLTVRFSEKCRLTVYLVYHASIQIDPNTGIFSRSLDV